MEKLTACPVCNNSSFSAYLEVKDHMVSGEIFAIEKCENCGFKFTNPRPDANSIGAYYKAESYISHSGTKKGLVNRLYHLVRNYTLGKKLQLANHLSKEKTLLDIGCGTGEFAATCQAAGWKVLGVEPDREARQRAIQLNAISVIDQDALANVNETFGLISMWHVLEHVHQLNERLDQVYRLLDDKGALLIAVPNDLAYDAKKYKADWAAYDVPRHLYHFNPSTIEKLLQKHHFVLKQILPMKFDAFYVSLLSESYQKNKFGIVFAFLNGIFSNLYALKDKKSYSSQIYIFKKEA